MNTEHVLQSVVSVIELAGVAAMLFGIFIAGGLAARRLMHGDGGAAAFRTLRSALGGAILLSLEIFVAADIVNTISTPSLQDAAVLGLIVLIRTVLSMSIQIEIEGVVPWKRALLRSGASVMAQAVVADASSADAAASGDETSDAPETSSESDTPFTR